MSSPKDIDSASTAELALVDLLYGELDGEQAEAARETVEADEELASELAALRDLRSLMSELPDEDPPASISAKLLHAAAEHAPAKPAPAEETGFFAWLRRLFQPVMLHPALSAAATLVLVAGVAGALYVSGQVDVSEPGVASRTEATGEATAHRDLPPVTGGRAAESAGPAAAPTPTDMPEPVQQAAEPAADDGVAETALGAEKALEGKAGATTTTKADRAKARPTGQRFDLSTESEAGANAWAERGEGGGAKKVPQRELVEEKPADKKADKDSRDGYRAGPAGGAAGGDTIEVTPRTEPELKKPAEESKSEEQERASRLTEVKQLHDRALRAAKDGECEAVLSLGAKIRKLDPEYYRKSFVTDARLRSCRSTMPNAFQ